MSTNIPIQGTLHASPETAPPATLADCSTSTLLDELQRRSLGCLLVTLRVQPGLPTFDSSLEDFHDFFEATAGQTNRAALEQCGPVDHWHYRLKGSPLLLGALSAALQLKLDAELRKR